MDNSVTSSFVYHALDKEEMVAVHETNVAEAEVAISRRKKKQDDRQAEQDARVVELKKEAEHQAEMRKKQNEFNDRNQRNYQIILNREKKNDDREQKLKERETTLEEWERDQDVR